MKIYIIGAGGGNESCLTGHAIAAIKSADIVVATKRLYEHLSHLNKNTVCCEIMEIAERLNDSKAKTAVVLASGDVGFYSVANTLKSKLAGNSVELISGISSLQYLTARLQIGYEDVCALSAHGRDVDVIPYVCYNKKTFWLTGGSNSPSSIIAQLVSSGLSDVWVTVGENLCDGGERISSDYAKNLINESFGFLSVMLIQNDSFVNKSKKLCDSDFIRGKVPMTKQAVRRLSISALEINPTDVVVDIGAGTGSCSIEMARSAYQGRVYAIEKQEEAVSLIGQNIKKFGAYNVVPIIATAPDGLAEIKRIDKAFIGGSSGNLSVIVDTLLKKNKGIKIVINAITLETVNEAIEIFKARGIEADVSCINVSVAERVGDYSMMKAQNPIYIIAGEGKGRQSEESGQTG